MDPKKAKWRTVSFKDNVMTITKDIPNIIVLVGGTVDPGNMLMNRYKNDPENFKRSESYDSPVQPAKDTNWYWSENEELLKSLDTIKKKYRDIHIFPYHGWSGDNCIKNREIAGAYLAERLCGANGEKPYYEQFLKADVSFHFIGHSHGGNVINEFTKHIATLKGWPEGWKIRTITYLSTPFYQKLHQVNTSKFDEDCKIFNVTNKYDLTQRCIADFSLEQLMDISATLKRSDIGKHIKIIEAFKSDQLNACLTAPSIKRDGWKMTVEWVMDQTKGANLYDGIIDVVNATKSIIHELTFILEALNSGTKYFANTENKNRGANCTKKLVSDILKNKILMELKKFEQPLDTILQNFTLRRTHNKYPVFGFLKDLELDTFFTTVINFLKIDEITLDGASIDIIHDFLLGIIDKFDDTTSSPLHQFKGTTYENAILNLSVSHLDKYHNVRDDNFHQFITNLEKLESEYFLTHNKKNLKQMILTLIVQHEFFQENMVKIINFKHLIDKLLMHWDMYDGLVNLENTTIEKRIRQFSDLIYSYMQLIAHHNPCGIVVEKDKEPKRGSLPYLLIISHSISRCFFHTMVAEKLEGNLDSILRK